MKVLFAVNNENISTQIVKKFQKEYKEIISYKNMYYFDAIIKELQRDKSYDRIVISEDLEPFSNNNYDAIDKFLFEKLDNISDEATGRNGEDIPIILISTERRMKSDSILVKLFGIGIYNALLGQDRSTDNICSLLNKPRGKKEAKAYYQIESEDVNYKSESEENVSEAEIKNILNHYKRLGKDEDRYIESFNNIAAQYNDSQLRIITKFLPLNVKAVLEEKSPKYQSVMTFGDTTSRAKDMNKKEEGLRVGFLKDGNTARPSNPVIVPRAVKKVATKKTFDTTLTGQIPAINKEERTSETNIPNTQEPTTIEEEINANIIEEQEPVKRGRGRPKKILTPEEQQEKENAHKRGRGRPRKVTFEPTNNDINIDEKFETILPGMEDDEDSTSVLPGFSENTENVTAQPKTMEEIPSSLPGFDNIQEDDTLPGFDEIIDTNENTNNNQTLPGFDDIDFEPKNGYTRNQEQTNNSYNNSIADYSPSYNSNHKFSGVLSKDKKIVSFVGTTKNGTSFLVNNVAKCLSSMGIKTAILDLTTNRNSYYIYTKNEEKLRNIALESINKLKRGETAGIAVDKFLDVYTALPGDNVHLEEVDLIISTLTQNYSVVLLDCDFSTISTYFDASQEIYVVQSMDILTIQPMTAFLRDLKAKDILAPEKIRIVINKSMRVRGLTAKAIIGGLAFYNDPAMAFMTELFNKETVKYCEIPFEEDVCTRYLEGVMDCEISINGYSKNFNTKLKELANMVYPLVGNKYKPVGDYSQNNKFSANINSTLEQMKNRY